MNNAPVLSLHGVIVVLSLVGVVVLALAKRITGVEALSVITAMGGLSGVAAGTTAVVKAVRGSKP